jgi:formylglycine-generating enzyme required for sulfatase activity
MNNNPSWFSGDDRPIEKVSWNDVQEFIKKLNAKEGTNKYRLPSEAEWEYACRAGTTTCYLFDDVDSNLNEYSWYSGYVNHDDWRKDRNKINTAGTHPVGQKKPNPWGLYDILGNVWEWCQDEYHESYEGAPIDGSAWIDGYKSFRVERGGSWRSYSAGCRAMARDFNDPDYRSYSLGFRLLREV